MSLTVGPFKVWVQSTLSEAPVYFFAENC